MLLRFVVSNFLSIGEEVELNLFPYTRLREHKDHIYQTPQVELLKAAAIYGANGAGKSNLVKAMAYLRGVAVSSQVTNERVAVQSFKLDKSLVDSPSHFEVEFYTESTYYAYGLSVKDGKIIEEWLYRTDPDEKSQEMIFERAYLDGVTRTSFHPAYSETEADRARMEVYEREFLTTGKSLIDLLAEVKAFTDIQHVHTWLMHYFRIITPSERGPYAPAELMDLSSNFTAFMDEILPKIGTGLRKLEIKSIPFRTFFGQDDPFLERNVRNALFNTGQRYVKVKREGYGWISVTEKHGALYAIRLMAIHSGKDSGDVSFELYEESDGTQRAIDLLVPLYLAMYEGNTVVIDEIGRSLHPQLVRSIVELYLRAPSNGQLIFTTHEQNLLSSKSIRHDEIWFTQKSSAGNTTIYPLSDFKVRNDLDKRKGYLNGRFGGVPSLGRLSRVELKQGA